MKATQAVVVTVAVIGGAVGFFAGQKVSEATLCLVQTGTTNGCSSCESSGCGCQLGLCVDKRVCEPQIVVGLLPQPGYLYFSTPVNVPCYYDWECVTDDEGPCDHGPGATQNVCKVANTQRSPSESTFQRMVLAGSCVPI